MIPVYSWAINTDENALNQIEDVASLPVAKCHVALMPDAHLGYGMPIGGVAALENAISANLVGVDIGCGMSAVRTNMEAKIITREQIITIRRLIKRTVPVGEGKVLKEEQEWEGFDSYGDPTIFSLAEDPPNWCSIKTWKWAKRSLGTLGGGNHFIEIQAGDDGYIWLMVHSGSRNLGSQIARYYHKQAIHFNELWHTELPERDGKKILDLAFLPTSTEIAEKYIIDMMFALNFAKENRARMMDRILFAFNHVTGKEQWGDLIDVHHNYASLEHHFGKNLWIHRKGAIQAYEGQLGIIPGSQGTKSYIVEGLGNIMSFKSSSHGAGRKMGRNEACKTLDPVEEATKMGDIVFDSWDKRTIKRKEYFSLDEAVGAYKDIDEVMEAQKDLVEIVTELTPLGVIKG